MILAGSWYLSCDYSGWIGSVDAGRQVEREECARILTALTPVLIRKGANLSLVLIIPGVIGGLVAFGIIGLFIGPVVLAVTYTLLKAWVMQNHNSETLHGRDGESVVGDN